MLAYPVRRLLKERAWCWRRRRRRGHFEGSQVGHLYVGELRQRLRPKAGEVLLNALYDLLDARQIWGGLRQRRDDDLLDVLEVRLDILDRRVNEGHGGGGEGPSFQGSENAIL